MILVGSAKTIALLSVLSIASRTTANEGSKTVHCGDIKQQYVYFNPEPEKNEPKKSKSAHQDRAFPAVVLLHGAGDVAENMVAAWKKLAVQQGIVLRAPQLPRG